ncbi:putative NAD(P)H-binding [Lyophyllum shimeji]|uniref:NAD(P)H-binding n=1 Tax=Lyophyllum shimeji TaxID=47721 RepID=A0A9P3UUE7_LYOSH|nr:putative NAD(P)H-binding [Lyophyllum shimeji]
MPRVLITGANGFIGANMVLHFIAAGFQVRGTVSGGKIDNFRKVVADKYPSLEAVQVDDFVKGDLTDAMKDVDAVIHVASPLPFGGAGPKDNLNTVVEGYVNVLRQAVKNGISKVVITGSWGSALDPTLKQAFEGLILTEKDWGSVTDEEFLAGNHDLMWTYLAARTLAERAAWDFAAKEPALDLAIINCPMIFGPHAPGFPPPEAGPTALTSTVHIYTLLKGAIPPPLPSLFCDVRDVARAHLAALSVPKAESNVQDKRFLICAGFMFWKDAVKYLHHAHPELKTRLPPLDAEFAPFPGPLTTIDATRAKEKLGMVDYVDWKQTLEATVAGLLEAGKAWGANAAVLSTGDDAVMKAYISRQK